MDNHIIVCGLGHVGYRVLDLLQRLKEPAFIIANNIQEEWKSEIESKNIPFLLGDASNPNLLQKAGINRAKAIIIATDNDLVNVSIVLDAKRLNPSIAVVARLFDQRLATQLEDLLNINKALSTSYLAAPAFAASVKGENIVSSFQVGDVVFNVTRMMVGSGLKIGGAIGEVEKEGFVTIALIRDRKMNIRPSAEDILAGGDNLIVIDGLHRKTQATSKLDGHLKKEPWSNQLRHFLKTFSANTWIILCGLFTVILFSILLFHFNLGLDFITALYFVITIMTTVGFGDLNFLHASPWIKIYGCFLMLCGTALLACLFSIVTNFIISSRLQELFGQRKAVKSNHVVIVGINNIGYRIIDFLRKSGEDLVAIALTKDEEFIETVRGWAPTIIGDPRSEDVLLKSKLRNAKALIAVTDDDVVNLSVGLASKKLNPNVKVVLRMFGGDLAQKVQRGFTFDAVLSTSTVSAPTFVGAALHADVINAFIVEDGFFIMLHKKIRIGSDWIGQSIQNIEQREDMRALFYKPSSDSSFSLISQAHSVQAGQEFIAITTKQFA